jgi:hypothetical protein
MKVRVFKDIKNKRWTIYCYDSGKHLGYSKEVSLKNVSFIVLEDKRKKINKTKKRFPHAWVIGDMITRNMTKNKNEINYNPI